MTSPGKAKIGLPLMAALVGVLAAQAQAQETPLATDSLRAPATAAPVSTPSLPLPTPRAVPLPQPTSTPTPAVRLPSVTTPLAPSISTPTATAPTIHVTATTSPAPSVQMSSSVTPTTSVSAPAPGPTAQALPTAGATQAAPLPALGTAAYKPGAGPTAHSQAAGNEPARSFLPLGAGAGAGPGSPTKGAPRGRYGAAPAGGVGAWQSGSGYAARAAATPLSAFTSSLAQALGALGQIGAAEPSTGDAVHPTRADRGAAPASSSAKDPLGLELPPQTGQAMMVALIALGVMLLLGVLFSDELQQLLSRLTQRPRG